MRINKHKKIFAENFKSARPPFAQRMSADKNIINHCKMFCACRAAHNRTSDAKINCSGNQKESCRLKNFSVGNIGEEINGEWNNNKHRDGSFLRHVGNKKSKHCQEHFLEIILFKIIERKF